MTIHRRNVRNLPNDQTIDSLDQVIIIDHQTGLVKKVRWNNFK